VTLGMGKMHEKPGVFCPEENNWLGSLASYLDEFDEHTAAELVRVVDRMITILQQNHREDVDIAYHQALQEVREEQDT